MQLLRAAGHFAVREGESNQYREHVRTADMSVGTYCIPVGGKDDQDPHTEDEVYIVRAGRARFVSDSGEIDVRPGCVIFVPGGEAHHFTDVIEDLSILVVFAPAERPDVTA